MTEQERNLIRDAMMFAVKDITGRVMREVIVQSMIDDFKKAINYTHSCTELKDKEVRTFEDFLRLFCEETGKQKWIYNDSVWSLNYLFYKYKELYKPL